MSAPTAPTRIGGIEAQNVDARGAIGRSLQRTEDHRLLSGRGTFAADISRPGMVHAAIVRSPHAAARIVSIDAGAARREPGVVDAFTAADLPDPDVRIPIRTLPQPVSEHFRQPVLANDVVRYVGEPVAVIIAESRYLAEDAAEKVEVRYEPLPVVLDPERALQPASPLLHPPEPNIAGITSDGFGDVDAVFESADLVLEERFSCQRHGAVPLEPRGLMAEVEPGTGRLVIWGATKVLHINRRILAGMLGLPEHRLRLRAVDVGGAFGARGEVYPEDFLVSLAALRLGRPVTFSEDRSENLVASNHSREQVQHVSVAAASDGTLLGLRARIVNNTGAYVRTHGMAVPTMSAAFLAGPYRWRAYRAEAVQVVTNKTPAGTYRAPGRFEATFVRERLVDMVARRLGLDPLDVRRRNLVGRGEMPYDSGLTADGHRLTYDSGDYRAALESALRRFDLGSMRRWRRASPPETTAGEAGPRRGLGFGFALDKSGIGSWDLARVSIDRDGRPTVLSGGASVGQGVQTALAQICAESLGVDYESVRVPHLDTDAIPDSIGSFASRTTIFAGNATAVAAGRLRRRLLVIAADLLGHAPDRLAIEGGSVTVEGEGPAPDLTIGALAREALARGIDLVEEERFTMDEISFPYGFHCAAVEVDPATGGIAIHRYAAVYDVGRAINPAMVRGQLVGAFAQGLGGALFEEMAYDDAGRPLATGLRDYLLPRAVDVPDVDLLVTELAPSPTNPLGIKGAGEGGNVVVGATLANAVSDALGTEVRELPLSPARVAALAAEVT